MLSPGEMFPSSRDASAAVEGTPMESVEHLGQYVFEMTQAKVKAMGDGDIVIEDAAPVEEDGLLEDEDELMGADEDEDIDIV